jgi:hypothetical protein
MSPAFSADDIRELAVSAGSDHAEQGVGYVVMVAPSAVAFGLGRMFQARTSEEFAAKSAVVSSVAEAYAWLSAAQEAHSGRATP